MIQVFEVGGPTGPPSQEELVCFWKRKTKILAFLKMAPGRGGGPSQPEKVAYSRICNVEVRVYRQRKFWFRIFFFILLPGAGCGRWPVNVFLFADRNFLGPSRGEPRAWPAGQRTVFTIRGPIRLGGS